MTRPLPPRFTYKLTVVSTTDGDTLRGRLERTVEHDDDFTSIIYTRNPNGTPIRLLWVNTPERADTDAWKRARTDTASWLAAHPDLYCETHGRDNLSRTLGDVYYLDPTGTRVSLSQWLITERGWLPYVEGR